MNYFSLIKHQVTGVLIFLLSITYAFSQSGLSQSATTDLIKDTIAVEQTLSPINIGYGMQSPIAINTAITSSEASGFNQGLISDPTQLIQGRVAGLQIYNRGGDPNQASILRLRGTALGVNTTPLIVVDGIIGASLQTVDPNDVARITVLKDAAATAIYGARAAAGVLLVETKRAKDQQTGLQVSYQGQGAVSQVQNTIPVLTADEFRAAGGVDLGASTNWMDEILQTAFSQTHGLSIGQTINKSNFRLSANYRDVEGILLNSGFEQINARLNFDTKTLNERLTVGLNAAYSHRASNYSFAEAFQYAVQMNPTAPVLGEDAPIPFNSEQYGGYYQTLGLFNSFNPVSILEQSTNLGRDNSYLLGAYAAYQLSDKFTFTGRFAHENLDNKDRAYYPATSLFRGNASSPIRKGRVDYLGSTVQSDLYETYFTYVKNKENRNTQWVTGYTHQRFSRSGYGAIFGDFEDSEFDFPNSFSPPFGLFDPDNISAPFGTNPGFISIASNALPKATLDALFTRTTIKWNETISMNASFRLETSNSTNTETNWTTFAALGFGIDLNQYLQLSVLDQLKLRVAWGSMGGSNSLGRTSSPIRAVVNGSDGSISTELVRNPVGNGFKKYRQNEFNIGTDVTSDRFQLSIDAYSRRDNNFLTLVPVDVTIFGVDNRYDDEGKALTQGIELNLAYELLRRDKISWHTI
ncbi:MAG: TonB-dependent receptor, partial [Bacteroidota bacterium]